MAYRIPNKSPLDLNQRKGIGIALPFDGDAVFISTLTTANQIKYNLINFILTSPGERLFNPGWGSSLKEYIFTNMSGQSSQGVNEFNNTFSQMGLQDLEQLIIREINNQFGGTINIQKFTISPNYDNNSISAVMFFNTPFGPTDVINFNL